MLVQPAFLFSYYVLIVLLLVAAFIGRNSRGSVSTNAVGYALVFVPVCWFFYILLRFSSDIPYSDDYNLLDTFYRMLYEPGRNDRIKAFFEQVNEHRFAFERTLMWGISKIFGYPSVKAQIVAGNLFMVGIVGLLYRFFKGTGLKPVYFAPVPLLAFSLLFYENSFWGIAAIQNTPLVFFALLAADGMSRESRRGDLLAFGSAIVISFVSGSGIAVWIIGAILYALQRRYLMLMLWVAVAGGILTFYFTFDYHLNPKDISNLFRHPVYNFLYAAAFWGNMFLGDYSHSRLLRFYPDVLLSVATGTVLLAVLGIWVLFTLLNQKEKGRKHYWFMLAGMLFFFATGAMLVASRPIAANAIRGGEVFSRRYVIFGVVLAACAYLTCLYLVRKKTHLRRWMLGLGLGLGTVMNFGAYYFFLPELSRFRREIELDPLYVKRYGAMLLTRGELFEDRLFWSHPTAFRELLQRLDSSGVYRLELPDKDKNLVDFPWEGPADPASMDEGWKYRVRLEPESGFNMRQNHRVTLEVTCPEGADARPAYFVIRLEAPLETRPNGRDFVLPAEPDVSGIGELIANRQYFTGRYSYTFWKTKFPPGNYRIGIILRTADGTSKPFVTGRRFRL